MCLSNLFINHPCKLVTTSIILLGLLTFFVYKKDYFMLTPDTNRQYMVFSDQKTMDWDKQKCGEKYIQGKDYQTPVRSQMMPEQKTVIVYEGVNLLDNAKLLKI